MPTETKITCDVCGERATGYPSFFRVADANEGMLVSAGGLAKRAPREPVVSTRGCLREQLYIFLCRGHFDSLTRAVEEWFAATPTKQEQPR